MNLYATSGQPDSTLAAIHVAAGAGAPPADLAKVALSQGNKYYKSGNGDNKNKDTLDLAIRFLSYSDSLDATPQAKFLMGASAFTAGYLVAQDAGKQKSCPQIKQASDYFTVAQTNLPAGLPVYPEPAKQLLTILQQQMNPFVQKATKAFCK